MELKGLKKEPPKDENLVILGKMMHVASMQPSFASMQSTQRAMCIDAKPIASMQTRPNCTKTREFGIFEQQNPTFSSSSTSQLISPHSNLHNLQNKLTYSFIQLTKLRYPLQTNYIFEVPTFSSTKPIKQNHPQCLESREP